MPHYRTWTECQTTNSSAKQNPHKNICREFEPIPPFSVNGWDSWVLPLQQLWCLLLFLLFYTLFTYPPPLSVCPHPIIQVIWNPLIGFVLCALFAHVVICWLSHFNPLKTLCGRGNKVTWVCISFEEAVDIVWVFKDWHWYVMYTNMSSSEKGDHSIEQFQKNPASAWTERDVKNPCFFSLTPMPNPANPQSCPIHGHAIVYADIRLSEISCPPRIFRLFPSSPWCLIRFYLKSKILKSNAVQEENVKQNSLFLSWFCRFCLAVNECDRVQWSCIYSIYYLFIYS